ncbi:MAG: TetR family transcriptional regulator C-terminal domain-containing protein [Clostridiales bacterium]|nr:TetR family transcriptional regulator C-terminal domain-containing protein [Clostridiales bacterium]
MFAFWYEHRDYLRIMVCSECLGLFTESFTRIILEIHLGFDMRSWPEQEQEQQAVSIFTTSGFISLLIYWAHHDFQNTPEEMGSLLYRMLTRPMYL